ncbi:MAG: hypothetical protein BWY66_00952 [bacterium ADurb.Bin374]|nr:MAG: hypothetical protein BWY66_00952 [bacterium ADurb.Bin374]
MNRPSGIQNAARPVQTIETSIPGSRIMTSSRLWKISTNAMNHQQKNQTAYSSLRLGRFRSGRKKRRGNAMKNPIVTTCIAIRRRGMIQIES